MRSPSALAALLIFALSGAAFAQLRPATGGSGAAGPLGANRPASIDASPLGAIAGLSPQPRPRRDNPTTSIQEFVRIEGHARSPLRGIGIVTGLKGTGDAGSELVLARPLARVYENNGNPLADLKELAKAKSAAIVSVYCDIPEEGARAGDTFDVYVQASHSATSLRGGTLLIAPLMGPLPGHTHSEPFAFAWGPITLDDAETPTSGRIRQGGQMRRTVAPKPVTGVFNLIVEPEFRSYSTTRTLAAEINGINADLEASTDGEIIATPLDDAMIRVTIPEHERANPANFVANIMTKRFSPSLIDLPAMVVVNERTGSIIVTGDVEISAVTVGSDRLVVTTTTPPPVPTAQDPLVTRENWTQFGTTASTSERARITDLLEAFKALNVPMREQIQVLAQIHQSGRLHAKFVRK